MPGARTTLVPSISGIGLRQATAIRKQSLKQQLIGWRGAHLVIRRLDALAKMQIIVRRGTRYYLNEPRVNSDSAIKSHDRVRRIVLKAAEQLSEMDTLGS